MKGWEAFFPSLAAMLCGEQFCNFIVQANFICWYILYFQKSLERSWTCLPFAINGDPEIKCGLVIDVFIVGSDSKIFEFHFPPHFLYLSAITESMEHKLRRKAVYNMEYYQSYVWWSQRRGHWIFFSQKSTRLSLSRSLLLLLVLEWC